MRYPLNKDPLWVDLHTHTSKSDGTLTPMALLNAAVGNNIGVLSITDHDTIEGLREIRRFINEDPVSLGLVLLNGIEISARYTGGTLHILGYGIDINHQPLSDCLDILQEIRRRRNQKILEKLTSLGISLDDKLVFEGKGAKRSMGRPHIARQMMEKGIVGTIEEAFDEYLGKRGKAFVEKELISAKQAVHMIHEAGGLAVLAHPKTLNLVKEEFASYLDRLISFGLDGIEVYTPLHAKQEIEFFKNLAADRQLLISAGSDFHGSIKPDIELGACYLGKRVSTESISKELIFVLS